MAVTMTTAEQALKIVYLGVVANQLNTQTNPFYNEIGTSSEDVYGKEIRKMTSYGVNGGVGAGTETGVLPASGGNNHMQFVSSTKNLYGTIEISDKSIQASQNNAGSFVNLLNDELEGLMTASKFNFGRMLFNDGTGLLSVCNVTTALNVINVASAQYLMEGQIIDILTNTGAAITNATGRRIIGVDRTPGASKITLEGAAVVTTAATDCIYMQSSKGLEITGLPQIFLQSGSLYGIDKGANYWMRPYISSTTGIISDIKIQKVIDYMDSIAGSKTNFLLCTLGVKRSYQDYMEATKRNVNTLDLAGGFKALSYNGIPLVADKFEQAGTLRALNTADFKFEQMGDWRWLEAGGGKILVQEAKTPIWTATLVKYADLLCTHPGGQGALTGVTEDDGTV